MRKTRNEYDTNRSVSRRAHITREQWCYICDRCRVHAGQRCPFARKEITQRN